MSEVGRHYDVTTDSSLKTGKLIRDVLDDIRKDYLDGRLSHRGLKASLSAIFPVPETLVMITAAWFIERETIRRLDVLLPPCN